jgi:hypothetical protein
MPIPKEIHFIWLGQRLPEERLGNILLWANINTTFLVNIWLDEIGCTINSIFGSTFSQTTKTTRTMFFSSHKKYGLFYNIIIKDINELQMRYNRILCMSCLS